MRFSVIDYNRYIDGILNDLKIVIFETEHY